MINTLKRILLISTTMLVSIIVGFYDYEYNKSFYHFFMFIFFIQIIYISYRIEGVISKLYELHKKWLGHG
jgi:hypothetical protein